MKGVIKRYLADKKFGFITSEASSDDLFFLITSVQFDRSLVEDGLEVSFDVTQGDKGPMAVNITSDKYKKAVKLFDYAYFQDMVKLLRE